MPGRALLALLLLAALYGAPPPAFAAGNALSAGAVSPGSGSTATVFSFSVRYEGKFAATGITAQAAGRALAMAVASGSAESGTWVAASTLPTGTWQVTFSAATDRGNEPSLAGPSVTVAGPPASLPPETPLAIPESPGADEPPASGAPSSSSDVPAETPEPAESAPGASTGGAAPAATTGAGGTGSTLDVPAVQAPREAGATPGTTDAPSAPAAGNSHPAGAASAPDARQSGDGTVGKPGVADDGFVQAVLLVGLAGVAGVALVGTAIILAGRRPRDDQNADASSAADPGSTAAILDRRTLRRAKVRLEDDPIIAALGIGVDAEPRHPRRRAGQVNRGPGERAHGPRP